MDNDVNKLELDLIQMYTCKHFFNIQHVQKTAVKLSDSSVWKSQFKGDMSDLLIRYLSAIY